MGETPVGASGGVGGPAEGGAGGIVDGLDAPSAGGAAGTGLAAVDGAASLLAVLAGGGGRGSDAMSSSDWAK